MTCHLRLPAFQPFAYHIYVDGGGKKKGRYSKASDIPVARYRVSLFSRKITQKWKVPRLFIIIMHINNVKRNNVSTIQNTSFASEAIQNPSKIVESR